MATVTRWLTHVLPILRWLPVYNWRERFFRDIVAGLTVTAVGAPEAVSYASIAGVPAEQTLLTGFSAPIVYGMFGSSTHLIIGPTAIMCILVNSAVPQYWNGELVQPNDSTTPTVLRVQLVALLSLAVAFLQFLFSLFRLGGLIQFVSIPVIAGFTSGSALLTMASQVPTLFGMSKCTVNGASCNVGQLLDFLGSNGSTIRRPVVLMSFICIMILLFFKKFPLYLLNRRDIPSSLRLPLRLFSSMAPLLLVLITVPIVVHYESQFASWGLEPSHPIPSGIPQPMFPFDTSVTRTSRASDYGSLLVSAIPLAAVGYMTAATVAKTTARQEGQSVDTQQELVAQSLCNFIAGVFRGLPVTGSISRTAVNASVGATSPLSSMFSGAAMAVALAVIAPTLAQIPSVARASIVVVAIARMVEAGLLAQLWREARRDAVAFLVTALVVSFVSAPVGLGLGTALHWFLALTEGIFQPHKVRFGVWTTAKHSSSSENDNNIDSEDRTDFSESQTFASDSPVRQNTLPLLNSPGSFIASPTSGARHNARRRMALSPLRKTSSFSNYGSNEKESSFKNTEEDMLLHMDISDPTSVGYSYDVDSAPPLAVEVYLTLPHVLTFMTVGRTVSAALEAVSVARTLFTPAASADKQRVNFRLLLVLDLGNTLGEDCSLDHTVCATLISLARDLLTFHASMLLTNTSPAALESLYRHIALFESSILPAHTVVLPEIPDSLVHVFGPLSALGRMQAVEVEGGAFVPGFVSVARTLCFDFALAVLENPQNLVGFTTLALPFSSSGVSINVDESTDELEASLLPQEDISSVPNDKAIKGIPISQLTALTEEKRRNDFISGKTDDSIHKPALKVPPNDFIYILRHEIIDFSRLVKRGIRIFFDSAPIVVINDEVQKDSI